MIGRIWALIERELRRFRRSILAVVVVIFGPLLQLVILGYAFGGTPHDLRVALVDQDHGIQALKLRELTNAFGVHGGTFQTLPYADEAHALNDLRNGIVDGVLTVPPGFSRRALAKENPRVAFIQNNADRFLSSTLSTALSAMVATYGSASPGAPRVSTKATLDVVELFPFVPYIQYLLPGTIVLAVFVMVMMGGAFSFMDDKALGLHEGYLVSPVTKLEMVAAFTISGAIKAVIAGLVLLILGLFVAGIPHPLEPYRLIKMMVVIAFTAFALTNLMFMLLARVDDPMAPRIASMLLNTLLFFPSGAVYPIQAFPSWMKAIAIADPFTYAVHALRSLLFQNTGLTALTSDLTILGIFSIVTMGIAAVIFRRTL